MEIDYELLETSIKFPIKADDYGAFFWDSENKMIAQAKSSSGIWNQTTVSNKQLMSEKICGEIKIDLPADKNLYTLVDGVFLDGTNQMIGLVRGWGDFQYETNSKGERVYNPERGAKIQDNLAKYLLACLNS